MMYAEWLGIVEVEVTEVSMDVRCARICLVALLGGGGLSVLIGDFFWG